MKGASNELNIGGGIKRGRIGHPNLIKMSMDQKIRQHRNIIKLWVWGYFLKELTLDSMKIKYLVKLEYNKKFKNHLYTRKL